MKVHQTLIHFAAFSQCDFLKFYHGKTIQKLVGNNPVTPWRQHVEVIIRQSKNVAFK